MMRPNFDGLPGHFKRARNYHLAVHPLHPPMQLMAALRQASYQHPSLGIRVVLRSVHCVTAFF